MKPACKNLRTKKMYIPALAQPEAEPENAAGHSCHCWCNRTLTEAGPDDRPVGAHACTADRECFEE